MQLHTHMCSIYTHHVQRKKHHHLLISYLLLLEIYPKMYCLQVAAYHLFFNASRLCYLLALLIFVFLRFFYIFHYISVVNHVGDSRTAAFLAITDTKQVHGELNVTFSGVFLGSVIQDIATNVF
ncbi:Transmembrane protein [Hirschfeldia incana]|nr:Transmembrane protein [Hirschfeldia incana]